MTNRAKRLTGLNPLAYLGVEPLSPPEFVTDERDPNSTDVNGFNLGTIWLNTVSEGVWMLVNLDRGVATWIMLSGAGGSVTELTGNTGGPVPPLLGNINVIGNLAVGITVAGNPGTHTLTITSTGGGPFLQELTGNSGGPVEPDAAGNINVVGAAASGLTVVGNPATHTLTIETSGGGGVVQTLTGDTGGAVSPDGAGNITVFANNATNNAGSSVLIAGNAGAHTLTLDVTDANENTLVGQLAGNATLTSARVTGLGWSALHALTTSVDSTAVGWQAGLHVTSGNNNSLFGSGAGQAITSGASNSAFGQNALNAAVTGHDNTLMGDVAGEFITGNNNTGIGSGVLNNLTSGSSNIALGFDAGLSLTGAESSNIVIGNSATVGDNNTIYIGTQGGGAGQQNRAFMAGVNGVTTASPVVVTIDTVSNQLGTSGFAPTILASANFSPTITVGGSGVGIVYGGGNFASWMTWTQGTLRFAQVNFSINVTNLGGNTGAINIVNLPFTIAATSPVTGGLFNCTFVTGINIAGTAGAVQVFGVSTPPTTTVNLVVGYDNGTGNTLFNDTQVTVPFQFGFTTIFQTT